MRANERASALMLGCAAALFWVLSPGARQPQGQTRFYVTAAGSSLVEDGLASPAPTGAAAADFKEVPAPGVRLIPTAARSTNVPWIDSNGWRYQRGLRKAHYSTLPAGSAALAAAEAFAFDAEAILNPDPADIEELRSMLRFLKAQERPALPALANIGVVDDPSPLMGELLNMLTRRNLLYRVVPSPDPSFDLTVRLRTADFPEEAALNPHEFAARVRSKLGDEKRLLRLYGTSTVIARLTAGEGRARLVLLQYSRGRRQQPTATANPQSLQVRLLGSYTPASFAAQGAPPGASLSDLRHPSSATEFWVPDFRTCAIIDLNGPKN
jgi:hypothetical protein